MRRTRSRDAFKVRQIAMLVVSDYSRIRAPLSRAQVDFYFRGALNDVVCRQKITLLGNEEARAEPRGLNRSSARNRSRPTAVNTHQGVRDALLAECRRGRPDEA